MSETISPAVTEQDKWRWLNTIKNSYRYADAEQGVAGVVTEPSEIAAQMRQDAWGDRTYQKYVKFVHGFTALKCENSQFNQDLAGFAQAHPDRYSWLENFASSRDTSAKSILITLFEYLEQESAQSNLDSRRQKVSRTLSELGVRRYVDEPDISRVIDARVKKLPGIPARYTPAEKIEHSVRKLDLTDIVPQLTRLSTDVRPAVAAKLIEDTIVYCEILEAAGIDSFKPKLLIRPLSSYAPILESFPKLSNQLVNRLLASPNLDKYTFQRLAFVNNQSNEHQEAFFNRLKGKFQTEYEQLQNSYQLNQTIGNVSVGETIIVRGDSEKNLYKKAEVGSLIESHLKLAGYKLRSQDFTKPLEEDPFLWALWNPKKITSVADKLIGKFNGNVMNLRFTALPVDEAYFKKFVFVNEDRSKIETDTAMRFAVAIDLKSSGKTPITNLIDTVLYMRDSEERGKSIVLSVRGRSKNEDPIEFLHLESVMNGVALEINALRHTFSAGLGSLGQRR